MQRAGRKIFQKNYERMGNTMVKEVERRELNQMPFDMVFDTENGEQLCHATGYEVKFSDDPGFWNEYEDEDGNLYYGR